MGIGAAETGTSPSDAIIVTGWRRIRTRSRSFIAWKIPWQPPCSTIHIVTSAAFLIVGAKPRLMVRSASVLPASVASKPQLANWTFFGSPPPRSSRIMAAMPPFAFSRFQHPSAAPASPRGPPPAPIAGTSAAATLVLDAVYGY